MITDTFVSPLCHGTLIDIECNVRVAMTHFNWDMEHIT